MPAFSMGEYETKMLLGRRIHLSCTIFSNGRRGQHHWTCLYFVFKIEGYSRLAYRRFLKRLFLPPRKTIILLCFEGSELYVYSVCGNRAKTENLLHHLRLSCVQLHPVRPDWTGSATIARDCQTAAWDSRTATGNRQSARQHWTRWSVPERSWETNFM